MELLYLWIEDHFTFKDCGFNFSSRYIFSESIDKKKKSFVLTIEENEDYVEDFFPPNIANITAIVGENGTGKSSLLDFIIRLQTDTLYLGEKFLVVYRDLEDGNLKLYDSLFDIRKSRKANDWKVKIIKPKTLKTSRPKQVYVPYNSFGIKYDGIKDHTSKAIYYSPIFDLKNYEYLKNQNKGYVDISTNFLIYGDSEYEDKSSFDQVDFHRFKNVYRQFNLVLKEGENFGPFDLPEDIEVRFNRNDKVSKDDLGTFTRGLYELIRDFGSSALHIENPKIEEARKSKNRSTYQKAKLEKVKVWFLINLIDNFFYNLALIYDLHDERFNVDREEIEDKDFITTVYNLFTRQDLIPSKEFSIKGFIDNIFNIIDEHAILDTEIEDNEAYFTLPVSKAFDIHKLHTNYLLAIKSVTENGIGFLDFNWRDLSSGEKAYLDLFARLFDAYRTITKDTENLANLRIIYFLIDEGEVGFHPQWQKKYIDWLTSFLTDLTDLKVQLIITSHSPFVLSDLPAANNILLKKVDHGKTSVVSFHGKSSTFGANIHELYSDSFFLQDGTIGEFARKKIYEAIDILRKDSLSTTDKNNVKRLINIVGEPLIKNRLMDMYNEKVGKESPEEKVARLERELQDAKNDLNNDKS